MKIKKGNITRTLHWFFACFVFVMLGIGIYMTKTEFYLPVYQWHKSLGVIFFLLIWIRLYRSIKHPWQSSFVGNKNEKLARGISHGLLLFMLIAMPVTGLLNSGFSGWSVHLFDLIIIPENFNSAGEVEPFNATIYETFKLLHRWLAYIFLAFIILHIVVVLKHHFIDKDDVLKHMLKGKKENSTITHFSSNREKAPSS